MLSNCKLNGGRSSPSGSEAGLIATGGGRPVIISQAQPQLATAHLIDHQEPSTSTCSPGVGGGEASSSSRRSSRWLINVK
jgi:hypothetical protein